MKDFRAFREEQETLSLIHILDAILAKVKEKFAQYDITDIDGVKIDFPEKWVHLRKSNTEPIIRIYSEAHTMQEAVSYTHLDVYKRQVLLLPIRNRTFIGCNGQSRALPPTE